MRTYQDTMRRDKTKQKAQNITVIRRLESALTNK